VRQFIWNFWFVIIALTINVFLGGLLFIIAKDDHLFVFTMGVMIALVVSILVTLLYIIATGFAALNLNDKAQALGLPEGSVRALIALILIVMWIGLSVYLFKESGTISDDKKNAQQLAQQLVTTMSTLVVAVAGFYFGTSSAKTRTSTERVSDTAAPRIDGISTPALAAKVGEKLEITGENLELVRIVQLRRRATSGATESLDGVDIKKSPTGLTATFDLSNAMSGPSGPWDIYVETADGQSDTSNRAVTVA
jgi:hypothetical protein